MVSVVTRWVVSTVLQPWGSSSVYWVQEACTLILYPSPDEELLAYQSPHCLVSVKQGKNAHQCFVYYTEAQDGEPLQSLSKFVRYLQSFRDYHSDRQNLAGQVSSTSLRPLQLGLIHQRRRKMLELLKDVFRNTAVLRASDFDGSVHVVFIMAGLLCNVKQHGNVASQRLP